MPSRFVSSLGTLPRDRHVPAADEHRGHRGDGWVQPRLDAPLDAAQVGLGGSQILLAREQQRDVDRDAGEDRLLDGRQPLLGAGNLDETGWAGRSRDADLRAAASVLRGVVGQQRRDLQRHPAVDAVGPRRGSAGTAPRPASRSSSASSKNSVFARSCRRCLPGDVGVVVSAVLDGVVEDRGIRGQPGDRELVDVALQRAAVQQLARDVVEPQALAQIVEVLVAFIVRPSGWKAGDALHPAARAGPVEQLADASRPSRPAEEAC